MGKSILYRLFGIGKLPAELRSTLNTEGLLFLDEAIHGSITYRDFRAPGKAFGWKRQWFTGSIALTRTRIVGLHYGSMAVNVPFSDERIHRMRFSVEKEGTLLIAFDASLFHPNWSGEIEYRFKTTEAKSLLGLLNEQLK